jgi:tRNA 2-thiouridine synthesizing protein E
MNAHSIPHEQHHVMVGERAVPTDGEGYLREHDHEHGVQAQVRVMVRRFSAIWGPERGSNHALHAMFPAGGPQKQGNRLAGLLRTKGEH